MMKRILLFCFFTICSVSLFAQIPINDDCGGIIDLGVGPTCDSLACYTNINATQSNIFNPAPPPPESNIPACWDNVNNDVWFQFTAPADGSVVDFTIVVSGCDTNGTPIVQPQLAVYRGACGTNNLAELLCSKSEVGDTELELDLEGLTPGLNYFLRVDAYSATGTPNWGDFNICVDTLRQVNTIDEGFSNSCTGELYDSGGPDGDYSNSENNVFTICPPAPNNACINFDLQYFNVDEFGDVINIYDGNDATGTPIYSIAGPGFNDLSGGGGVCLSAQASSGCLTIEMVTDGNTTFEGFAANWECSSMPCEVPTGLVVDGSITDADIVDAIATPQTTVTIDTIICGTGAYGTFIGDGTDLGLEKGLVLTSGSIQNTVGPNTQTGAGDGLGLPGDADLDYLSVTFGNGSLSNDACIVELDVFAATDELAFEYTFGSEEYTEFVNSSFNDIFAFLISGPDIVGDPGMGNQLNIATLPGTNTSVEINSVNNLDNWEYYRNNEGGQSVEYDGLTSDFLGVKKSLTARATVTPCNTYHLKLAVADRGDGILDSGVFISELKGGTPQLSVNFASGIDYLIEDCSGTSDELLISLNNPQDDAASYNVVIGGTAQLDIDYTLNIPSTITIPAGETILNFPIVPIVDNIPEGIETITIALTNNFGCGDVTYTEITIELADEPSVVINLGADTAFVCQGIGAELSAEGATTYFWDPVSVVDDPFSPNPFATPTTSQWVSVIGQVGICTDTDSVYLQVIDPAISIAAQTVTDICEGTPISLLATHNVNDQDVIWSSSATPASGTGPVFDDTPLNTTTYTAIAQLQGCSATDTYTVNVDPFDFPELTTVDTTLCESYSFMAANPIPGTSTTYEWTPNQGLNNNTLPNPTITAQGNVTYTVVATSANGYCSQTADVQVLAIPALVDITNDDYIEICLGESIDLLANTSTQGVGFEWSTFPVDPTLADITDTMQTVTPTMTTTYITELEVGACLVYDTITIRVDSLPDLSMVAVPEKDVYCRGDIISIITPTYEPSNFPDIMHQWMPGPGINSDLENLNLVLIADGSNNYERITTNRGCDDTTSYFIEVVDPILELTVFDTTICPGTSFQVQELQGEDHMWTFTNGSLNCTDCPDPIVSELNDEGEFIFDVSATIEDCPADTFFTVTVSSLPQGFLSNEPVGIELTQGTDVTMTANITNGNGLETFEWTLNGAPLGNTNPIPSSILEPDNLFVVNVTNEFGCTNTLEINILGLLPQFDVPNVFTPDGDGDNDFFNVTYFGGNPIQAVDMGPLEVVRFSIFNRWGQMVYNNENPTMGWDGRHNDEIAPSDVYVYFIDVKKPNGEIIKFEGDLSLVR